jgi:hypothetical protein
MKPLVDRRGRRRKEDEDIAERISGGVRLDRSSVRGRECDIADKRQPERRAPESQPATLDQQNLSGRRAK